MRVADGPQATGLIAVFMLATAGVQAVNLQESFRPRLAILLFVTALPALIVGAELAFEIPMPTLKVQKYGGCQAPTNRVCSLLAARAPPNGERGEGGEEVALAQP